LCTLTQSPSFEMLILLMLLSFLQCFAKFADCSCPPGLELVLNGQCRGLYTTMKIDIKNNLAVSKCKEIQGQPITIHTNEEQSYWTDRDKKNRVYIGIVCNSTSSKWEWADGSPIDYKPPVGKYNQKLDDNCSNTSIWFLHGDTYWREYTSGTGDNFDIYCTKQLHQPVQNGDGCDSFEDDREDGVCYKVGGAAKNWQDGQDVCRKMGANLASIHNLQENLFVRRLAVSKGAVNAVFIGGVISGKGNDFGWVDGSKWNYSNFETGFPNTGHGDCLAMDARNPSGQWINTNCLSNLPFACLRQTRDSTPKCDSGPWNEEQIIYSPGFPFTASTPCDFNLTVDSRKKVHVEVLLLEANSCCDRLTITDGKSGGKTIAE
ncbi:hypothetical protein PENTCL1PPCAC_5079, partial [Pristionchus entomophagus]